MKAEIDIKTMIAIVASVGVLGGFYYTTQMRLDNIEQDIIQLQPIHQGHARLRPPDWQRDVST